MTKAPGVPAPLPRPSAIGRLPIIEASGAAAAITRKTMREVESEARFSAGATAGGVDMGGGSCVSDRQGRGD